jgi:hypothetical protein
MANAPKPSYRYVDPNTSIKEEKKPTYRASNRQGSVVKKQERQTSNKGKKGQGDGFTFVHFSFVPL